MIDMGVNKVEINGESILDLTGDSVTPETLAEGVTAHNAAGEPIVGTMLGNEGYDTGDFIIHVICTPEHQIDGTNAFWVYDPCDMTPTDYMSLYESGREIKVKAEIPMDDGSMLTVVAPFAGESSTKPGEMAYVVVYDQTEYKFTVIYRKAGDDVDGYPYYLIAVELHDPVVYANTDNLTTYLSAASTDNEFPSAKAVVEYIEDVGLSGGEANIFHITTEESADGRRTLITCEYQEVLDAIRAKKVIAIDNKVATVGAYNDSSIYVYFSRQKGQEEYTIKSNKVFSNTSSVSYLSTADKVTSITASATDTQIPTAKAVYNLVQNSGGGGAAVAELFYVPFQIGATGFELDGVTYSDIMTAWQAGKRIIGKAYIPEQAGLGFAGNFELDMTYLTADASFVLGFITGPMSVEVFIASDNSVAVDIKQLAQVGAGGGSAEQEIVYVIGTFEMATMSYSTDTPYAEIAAMINSNKYVVGKTMVTMGGTVTNVAWMPLSATDISSGVFVFEGTMQAHLGALNPALGLVLLATSVEVCVDDTINTRVRVVSTTDLN